MGKFSVTYRVDVTEKIKNNTAIGPVTVEASTREEAENIVRQRSGKPNLCRISSVIRVDDEEDARDQFSSRKRNYRDKNRIAVSDKSRKR